MYVIVTVGPGDDVGFPSPVVEVAAAPKQPAGCRKPVTVIIDADGIAPDGKLIPLHRLERLVTLAVRKALPKVVEVRKTDG